MITVSKSLIYWNYFLALENDLEVVSRYIEFIDHNFETYSIELASLLLSSSSEIDVIMKELCGILATEDKAKNIKHYRNIIKKHKSDFVEESVFIPRYGITLNPWINWKGKNHPDWWRSYNNVKHKRNLYFNEANLQNVLNSLGALLITIFYYYWEKIGEEKGEVQDPISITTKFQPESKLFRLKNNYYLSSIATMGRI